MGGIDPRNGGAFAAQLQLAHWASGSSRRGPSEVKYSESLLARDDQSVRARPSQPAQGGHPMQVLHGGVRQHESR